MIKSMTNDIYFAKKNIFSESFKMGDYYSEGRGGGGPMRDGPRSFRGGGPMRGGSGSFRGGPGSFRGGPPSFRGGHGR